MGDVSSTSILENIARHKFLGALIDGDDISCHGAHMVVHKGFDIEGSH
jgi:hypothetical protein